MNSIWDVADYYLDKNSALDPLSLSIYCYLSQGWHMAWNEDPLFEEDFSFGEGYFPIYAPFFGITGLKRQYDERDRNSKKSMNGKSLPLEELDLIWNLYKDWPRSQMVAQIKDEAFFKEKSEGAHAGEIVPKEIIRDQYKHFAAEAKEAGLSVIRQQHIKRLVQKGIVDMVETQRIIGLKEEDYLEAMKQTLEAFSTTVEQRDMLDDADRVLYDILKLLTNVAMQGAALYAIKLDLAPEEITSSKDVIKSKSIEVDG